MRNALARLAATDEANLVLDRAEQVNVFLVAGQLAPGGFIGGAGTADLDALRAVMKERIEALAPLRRALVTTAFGHRWTDAAAELEHHIRLSDPVDGLAGLEAKCAELMCVPLPRDRPLWELLVLPSTTSGPTGIVLRIHHAVADGMVAVAIVQQLLGAASPQAAAPAPLPGTPENPADGRISRTLCGSSGWARGAFTRRFAVARSVRPPCWAREAHVGEWPSPTLSWPPSKHGCGPWARQ